MDSALLKAKASGAFLLVIAALWSSVGRTADGTVNRDAVTGDAEKGELAFTRDCALCHTISKDGPNGFGPNLFGIVDRKAAIAKDYRYSAAFRSTANWTWSPDGIASFIIAPSETVPGNRMAVFQGVSDTDLDDIIAYLATKR